jgi:cytidylate kinase
MAMVIAIDGPAGAGKSTVARALAVELGFTYLNSGALYRCVALLTLVSPTEEPAQLARTARIELSSAPGGAPGPGAPSGPGAPRQVLLDGRDVTAEIRAPEVSETASRVAADPGVRKALLAVQRGLLATGDWVAEGRDIGTVVAPDAKLKVFLTASTEERARRRAAELGAALDTVLAEQTLRDARDATRAHSPLRPAHGAVTLDTSGLRVEDVVARIVAMVRS